MSVDLQKTGECYFRDEQGILCLAESFLDTSTGEVTTVVIQLETAVVKLGEADESTDSIL